MRRLLHRIALAPGVLLLCGGCGDHRVVDLGANVGRPRLLQGTADAVVFGLAVGSDRSVLVTGSWSAAGTFDFGSGPLAAQGEEEDLFVAAYDAGAELRWVFGLGASVHASGRAVAAAPDGSVFATGLFTGSALAGDVEIDSGSGQDVPLIHLGPAGGVLDVRTFGGEGNVQGRALDVDDDGWVGIGGLFGSSVSFGGGELGSFGGDEGFMAVLDDELDHVWSRPAVADETYVNGVAFGGDGALCAVGRFENELTLAPGLVSHGNADVFAVMIDRSGAVRWATSFGGESVDIGYDVAVGPNGDCVVCGYLGEGELAELERPGFGQQDGFVATLDGDTGVLVELVRIGGPQNDVARALVIDDAGGVWAAGHFWGTATFGDQQVTAAGGSDAFVARVEGPGVTRLEGLGGEGHEEASGIAIDRASGEIVTAGTFVGETSLGEMTGTSLAFDPGADIGTLPRDLFLYRQRP